MRVEEADSNFYVIKRPPKKVLDFLKHMVPSRLRFLDQGLWYVHRAYLIQVLQVGYKYTEVDYLSLEKDLKDQIDELSQSWTKNTKRAQPSAGRELHLRALHLRSDAPQYVIDAVWKAVARHTHPDKGGDPELFKAYSEAYNNLKR